MEVHEIGIYATTVLFMMVCLRYFLVLKYPAWLTGILCFVFGTFCIALDVLRVYRFENDSFARLGVSVLQYISILGLALLISQKKNAYAVFMALTASNMALTGVVITTVTEFVTNNVYLGLLAGLLFDIVTLRWLIWSLRDVCLKIVSKNSVWFMCLIPAMFYICFYSVVSFPVRIEEHPENILAMILIFFTMLITYLLMANYIEGQVKAEEAFQKNTVMQTYIKGMNIQSEAISEARDRLRIIRHDIRHNRVILYELLEQGKYEEAKQYLKASDEQLMQGNLENYCENVVVNSILSGMRRMAVRSKVSLEIQAVLPEKIAIDVMELSIVVANLVENGIHATAELEEGMRWVRLLLKQTEQKKILLEVVNPCEQVLTFDAVTGFPYSTKGEGHGIGGRSISQFADKYQAEMDCYQEDGRFIVRIMV